MIEEIQYYNWEKPPKKILYQSTVGLCLGGKGRESLSECILKARHGKSLESNYLTM